MTSIKTVFNKFRVVKKEKVLIPFLDGAFLNGRRALITGASSGIGAEIAKSFVRNGASVVLTGRNIDKLKTTKTSIMKGLSCDSSMIDIAILDITKINDLDKSFEKIKKLSQNKIDIFVNNAGVNCGELFPNTSEHDFDSVINTNLKGSYFASQMIAKYMIENRIEGNILNITSSSALRPAITPYIVSKWGERGLTLGMAKKYMPYGIVVNAIAPGSTATEMIKHDGNLNDLYCDYTPTERYLAPEEVANMATILVSKMGRMIIGDTIYMTGGAGVITYDDMKY